MTTLWITSGIVAIATAVGWWFYWRHIPNSTVEHTLISIIVGIGVGLLFWMNLAMAYA